MHTLNFNSLLMFFKSDLSYYLYNNADNNNIFSINNNNNKNLFKRELYVCLSIEFCRPCITL